MPRKVGRCALPSLSVGALHPWGLLASALKLTLVLTRPWHEASPEGVGTAISGYPNELEKPGRPLPAGQIVSIITPIGYAKDEQNLNFQGGGIQRATRMRLGR